MRISQTNPCIADIHSKACSEYSLAVGEANMRTPIEDPSLLYSVTVGWWGFWAVMLAYGLLIYLFVSHDHRKRKRNIRDLCRQGKYHEASIASAQHERAGYEEALGANAGTALGVIGHRDKQTRDTVLMLSGAGVVYNTRQLDHFDSIDFEEHRRRHEAHLRKKYPAPPAPARPAQHTIHVPCLTQDCSAVLRSTNNWNTRRVVRCPRCGLEQWHRY